MSEISVLGALAEVASGAESLEAYERGTMEIVGRCAGFDVAMFQRASGAGVYRPGIDPKVWAACQPYWSEFGKELTPVVAAAAKSRSVAVDVDVLGLRRFERLSVYRRLIQPHRGTSTAMVYLSRRGRLIATLALGRTRGSFSDAELDALRALAPTLSVCEASTASAGAFGPDPAKRPRLTAREREVLDFVRLGFTNAQIGRALGSSEHTVRNQLSSVYEKLGAANRAEAVAIAVEYGLVASR